MGTNSVLSTYSWIKLLNHFGWIVHTVKIFSWLLSGWSPNSTLVIMYIARFNVYTLSTDDEQSPLPLQSPTLGRSSCQNTPEIKLHLKCLIIFGNLLGNKTPSVRLDWTMRLQAAVLLQSRERIVTSLLYRNRKRHFLFLANID